MQRLTQPATRHVSIRVSIDTLSHPASRPGPGCGDHHSKVSGGVGENERRVRRRLRKKLVGIPFLRFQLSVRAGWGCPVRC